MRLWQHAPLAWRTSLVRSRFAPVVRRLMNSVYKKELEVFPLAAPLDGWRMRLEWRSSKAFIFGTYEREVVHSLCEIVQPGSSVVQAGAHIGYFTLLLAKLVGPKGKVIAFEPVPENFRVLAENVEMNGCRNVVLEKRAVAATSGFANLRMNDHDRLTYTASLLRGGPALDVEAISLDDYISHLDQPIHFVMMDVEGAEADVLEGMRNTLRRDLPKLLIELHGFDALGQSHPALRTLRDVNYSFRFLEPGGAQVHAVAEARTSGIREA